MADDKYVFEAAMDESSFVRGMASIDASVQRTVASLTSLGAAMKQLESRTAGMGKTKGASWMQSYALTDKQAEALTQQVTAMKKASDAAASFGKASSALKGVDISASANRQAKAITSMGTAMKSIASLSADEIKALQGSIALYNQAAAAARNVASADQARARAIAAVKTAQASQVRASGMTAYQEELIAIKQQQLALAQSKEQRIAEAAAARAASKEKADAARAAAAADKAAAAAAATANREKITAEKEVERQAKAAAAADAQAVAAEQKRITALETSRFAARELAAAYTKTGLALGALPVAGIYFASSQERAFADVQRTTQESLGSLTALRNQYSQLSTEIPISFEALSQIGTLGAQMDIPISKLGDFTTAVGEFAAITGVSTETAAMGFGRLDNMMSNSKRNADAAGNTYSILASQVAELGAKSVATESEILTTAQSIATTASVAGMSQDDILAYSAALASLKVPAEWARGSMQRIFGTFNTAVADGGKELGVFASQLGITSEQAANLWRSDPSQFFNQLLVSIKNAGDGVAQWQAIANMGFTNTRDVQMLQRLANGYSVVAQAMRDSADAGKDSNFLRDSMNIIAETASATFTRLGNAFKNFLAGFGEEFLTPVKGLMNGLIGILNMLNQMPSGLRAFIAASMGAAAVVMLFKALVAMLTGLAGTVMNVSDKMRQMSPQARPGIASLVEAWKLVVIELNNVQTAAGKAATAQVAAAAEATAAVRGKAAAETAGAAATTAATAATAAGTAATIGFGTAARTVFSMLGGWPMLLVTIGSGIISAASASGIFQSQADKTAEAAKSLTESMGGTTSIANAIVQDTLDIAKGTQTAGVELTNAYTSSSDASTKAAGAAQFYVTANGDVVESAQQAGSAVDVYTAKLGDNFKQLILNSVQNNKAWSGMSADVQKTLNDMKFNLTSYIQAATSGGPQAAQNYINGFLQPLIAKQKELQDAKNSYGGALGHTSNVYAGTLAKTAAEYDRVSAAVTALNTLLGADGMGDAATQALVAQELLGSGFTELGTDTDTAKDSVVDLTQSISSFVDKAFEGEDAAANLGEAMMNMADSIAENGTTLDPNSEAGRANISAVKDYFSAIGDEAVAGINELGLTGVDAQNYMQDMIQQGADFLGQQGFDMTSVQDLANNILKALGFTVSPGVDTTQATQALYGLATDAKSVADYVAQVLNAYNKEATQQGMSKADKAWGARYTAQAASLMAGGNGGMAANQVATFRGISGGVAGKGTYTPGTATLDTSGFKRSSKSTSGSGGSGGNGGSGGGSKATKDATKTAAEQFEDFISRLSKAMKDAIDKFWSSSDAADAYHKSLNSLSSSIQTTKNKIEDLRKSNARLTTDLLKDQQTLHDAQFYNQIATKYGDTERMQSTQTDVSTAQADIADKNAQIAANNKEAASLQAGMFALTGYSEAAIANRAAIKDLQTQMVGLIENYAESGASTAQVTAYTAQLKQEFINQVTQLGFNRAETTKLAGAFDGLSQSIRNTPRNVNINVSDNGSAAATQNRINGIHGGNVNVGTNPDYGSADDTASKLHSRIGAWLSRNKVYIGVTALSNVQKARQQGHPDYWTDSWWNGGGYIGGYAGGGRVPGNPPSNRSADNILARGPRGLYGIRSGEYIISQPAVDYYGLSFMDAINSMSTPVVNVNAPASSGAQPVMLMPNQLNQLAQMVSSIVIVGNDTVSRASNAGNVNTGNRGVY